MVTPSRNPPSSDSATRAPKSRTASMAALEKTFALMSNSLAPLPSRGSTVRRIGPRVRRCKLHARRTRLIWSCRMLCWPRNRLRNSTSVGVRMIRKLRSHAKANPDTTTATSKPVTAMPRNALPHTTSHGRHESPPTKIHAGRSALYRIFMCGLRSTTINVNGSSPFAQPIERHVSRGLELVRQPESWPDERCRFKSYERQGLGLPGDFEALDAQLKWQISIWVIG